MAAPILPFWLAAFLVIMGMLMGLLIGFVALSFGVGDKPNPFAWLALGAAIGLAQGILAPAFESVRSLVITSSVVNGLLGLGLGWRLWRRSRSFGTSLGLLASAPFTMLGLAYPARLWVIGTDLGPSALSVATLVILLVMAFSSLRLSFALSASHAARLNATLRIARDKTEAASVLKSRFLANMSHELRTPLNGILGMAQGLDGIVQDPQGKDMLLTMSRGAQTLLGRLTDILELSELQSGRLPLQNAAVNLQTTLRATLDPRAQYAHAKGVDFQLHC
ncbi:MAG: sensor histidine kinase [Roseinatronobacter sp.]